MKTLGETGDWTAALHRAAELGRQQGWNEAIEAAAVNVTDNVRSGTDAKIIAAVLRTMKMPTQEKK